MQANDIRKAVKLIADVSGTVAMVAGALVAIMGMPQGRLPRF